MSPYPYGFVRDATACNFEKTELYLPEGSLRDLRDASGAQPGCKSPFGVSDMVGNVDEWTVRESKVPALRPHLLCAVGGGCPDETDAAVPPPHTTKVYNGPQTGFRCCAWPG